MNRTIPFLAAVVVAVVVGSSTPAQPPQTATVPADLAWVPPDSAGFIHVKFAALWDSPLGRDVRKAFNAVDPKILAEVEKEFGLSLSQIEYLTLVLPELIDDPHDGLALRVTTTEPYDREKILSALRAEPLRRPEVRTASPATLYEIKGKGLLHLSSPRAFTLLFDEKGAAGLLGRLLSRRTEGPLTPALKMAGGDHHVVAALDMSQLPEIPADAIPPELAALRDVRFALLTGKLDAGQARLDAQLTFARPGLAVDGAKAVEEGRKLLLKQIADVLEDLARDDKENRFQITLLNELTKAIKDAKVETKEASVQATAQLAITQAMTKLLSEGAGSIQIASSRTASTNNLKQIGLALHNYHDVYGALPPAAICDKNGKPLLSWRVAVLPFIEQDNLYKQFKLDEPWDSEHNKKLLVHFPKVYMLPGDKKKHDVPSTHYQALVGNNAMFDLRKGTKFAQITDGSSNTLMVVEASSAVPWTRPDDISYDPKQLPALGYHYRSTCNVLLGDGSVRALPKTLKPEILHLLIQRNDGNPIPSFR